MVDGGVNTQLSAPAAEPQRPHATQPPPCRRRRSGTRWHPALACSLQQAAPPVGPAIQRLPELECILGKLDTSDRCGMMIVCRSAHSCTGVDAAGSRCGKPLRVHKLA